MSIIAPTGLTRTGNRGRANELDALRNPKLKAVLPPQVRDALGRRQAIREFRADPVPNAGKLLADAIAEQAVVVAQASGSQVRVDLSGASEAQRRDAELTLQARVLAEARTAADDLLWWRHQDRLVATGGRLG